MSFKRFLEAPHYINNDIKVSCPLNHVIDVENNVDDMFDYGLENGPYDKHHKLTKPTGRQEELFVAIRKIIGMDKNLIRPPQGVFPFYCVKHDLLFMYDFGADHGGMPLKPRNDQDKEDLQIVKNSINRKHERDGEKQTFIKIWGID